MNLYRDIILVNRITIKKSLNSFIKNWVIIFTGIAYTLINLGIIIFIGTIFRGELSILAGLIMGIVSSSLISNYLYLLFNIINYDKISLNNFKDGFKHFLWKIYGVFFIAWIGSFILSSFVGLLGTNQILLSKVISIVLIVAVNPLPETLYQKYLSSGESIKYAFEFMNGNWINWAIPNLFFHLILYLITKTWLLNIFTTHINFSFVFTIKDIGLYIVSQVLFSFIMIYRGHLFKLLSTSTLRKRIYMNNFYN